MKPCKKCGGTDRFKSGPCRPCSKKYVQANKEHYRVYFKNYHRERTYGLTEGGFNRLLTEQGGCCAICRCVPKKYFVDHCHDTGKVRGLLCPGCNTALGQLNDDPTLVRRALEYITDGP